MRPLDRCTPEQIRNAYFFGTYFLIDSLGLCRITRFEDGREIAEFDLFDLYNRKGARLFLKKQHGTQYPYQDIRTVRVFN